MDAFCQLNEDDWLEYVEARGGQRSQISKESTDKFHSRASKTCKRNTVLGAEFIFNREREAEETRKRRRKFSDTEREKKRKKKKEISFEIFFSL